MKKLVIAVLVMASSYAHAQTSATVTAASNYIWRGLSFSSLGQEAAKGAPVIQGSIDYVHSSGFGANMFVGGADTTNFDAAKAAERDNEFDPTVSYTYAISEDLKVVAAVTGYLYVKNSSNNTIDYQLGMQWKSFRLDASYIDKYFGFKSTDTYFRLSTRQPIDAKVGVLASVGSTTYGDEQELGWKNYIDYRVGLYYGYQNLVLEMAYSATDRKDISDVELNDKAATMSVGMSFQ